MKDFAKRGALKPLDFAKDAITENFSPTRGSSSGRSTASSTASSSRAPTSRPSGTTSRRSRTPASSRRRRGTTSSRTRRRSRRPACPPYSIGGADGWTLTDLFENIYLRTAGAESTTSSPTHEIPWTDPSVKDALTKMAKIFGDTDNIAGGTSGALQTDFPTSVTQRLRRPAEGGDGARGRLRRRRHRAPNQGEAGRPASTSSRSRRSTARPSRSSAAATSSSCSRTTRPREALVEYLATPEAAEIWAKRGGFSSPNKNVDTSVYPDAITQDDRDATRERGDRSASTCPTCSRPRSAATSARASSSCFQDFLKNPRRRRHRDEARGGGGRRTRLGRTQVSRERQHHGRSLPSWRLRPRRAPARWRGTRCAARLPRARRSSCSASGSSTRRSRRSSGASSTTGGDEFVGFDNYKHALHDDRHAQTAIKNNALWVADRAGVRDRVRAHLRRAHRADALVGRVQDRPSSCRWRSRSSRPA